MKKGKVIDSKTQRERGGSLLEYALLISLISLLVVVPLKLTGKQMFKDFLTTAESLNVNTGTSATGAGGG